MTAGNPQLANIRSVQRWLHIWMIVYLIFTVPVVWLDTSADIVVSVAPVIILLHIVVAAYIGQLASAKNRNGVMWALVAAFTPCSDSCI